MKQLNLDDVRRYIKDNIGSFHKRRGDSLHELKLSKVLLKKNPYLFKAKNIQTSEELVKALLDAFISSQEETIFGEFLEGLAIFTCNKVHGGRKSSAEGIDLEFEKNNVYYIITVKSGPNWGNSGQIREMISNFKRAKRILQTSKSMSINILAINGCCYGKMRRTNKGDYFKLCGQEFWELITDNDRLYLDIIEPLSHQAKQRSEEFNEEYLHVLSDFVIEFQRDFCDGIIINWEKLVKFNSGKYPNKLVKEKSKKKKAK